MTKISGWRLSISNRVVCKIKMCIPPSAKRLRNTQKKISSQIDIWCLSMYVQVDPFDFHQTVKLFEKYELVSYTLYPLYSTQGPPYRSRWFTIWNRNFNKIRKSHQNILWGHFLEMVSKLKQTTSLLLFPKRRAASRKYSGWQNIPILSSIWSNWMS